MKKLTLLHLNNNFVTYAGTEYEAVEESERKSGYAYDCSGCESPLEQSSGTSYHTAPVIKGRSTATEYYCSKCVTIVPCSEVLKELSQGRALRTFFLDYFKVHPLPGAEDLDKEVLMEDLACEDKYLTSIVQASRWCFVYRQDVERAGERMADVLSEMYGIQNAE